MSQTIDAIFDGDVLRPVEPLDLEPNTRVTVHIQTPAKQESEPYGFLQVLREAHLEGPPDWAENFDEYRSGQKEWPSE